MYLIQVFASLNVRPCWDYPATVRGLIEGYVVGYNRAYHIRHAYLNQVK